MCTNLFICILKLRKYEQLCPITVGIFTTINRHIVPIQHMNETIHGRENGIEMNLISKIKC